MKHHIKTPALCAVSLLLAVSMALTGCGSADPSEDMPESIAAAQSTTATAAVTTAAANTTSGTTAAASGTTAPETAAGSRSTTAKSTRRSVTASDTVSSTAASSAASRTARSNAVTASAAVTTASRASASQSSSRAAPASSAATATATTAKTAAPAPVTPELNIPYISGTSDSDGFIRGMDVSSVLALYEAWKHSDGSAHFKDFNGRELDIQGFFDLLHDSGANYIRLRVWNDPFDSGGNPYGGGNVDIDAAVTIGRYVTKAGMKLLVDFHYSDFWADPGKQQAPKAWAGMSIGDKETALYDYTADCLKKLTSAGVNVGMVQLGNETTGRMCGESSWDNICRLFSAGAKAVREAGSGIMIAVHFTNPEKAANYRTYAKQLSSRNVDYDVFASSWYPFWHGTVENLTSILKEISDTYGKKVMVAETSWPYTSGDGDGSSNSFTSGSSAYAISPQGQADLICDVARAMKSTGQNGLGMFYWEPAWIPVQVWDKSTGKLSENKALWEKYGAGWATSYAGEYDPDDAGKWYGGSSWDNQALFSFDGTPLASLRTYKLMQQK